jgi:PAS domain S-box-containing protein/putative nucleotidyltransferase with HDIG domain
MATILIADDIDENRYLLKSMLKGFGYKVTAVTNGAEALKRARQNPPNLIIADILMPVMDGWELCRQWKAHNRLKQIPFVFYTATYTDPKDEQFAHSLGADRFIVKPQKPEKLEQIVREVLEEYIGTPGITSPRKPLGEEMEVLRQYNEVLFRKLEKKMTNLQTEIAERKQAEEAVRESETRFRTIFESIPDCIIVHDDKGTILHINEIGARQLEWSVKDLLGRNLREIVTPEQRALVDDHIRETHKAGSCWFETTYVSRSGWQIIAEIHDHLIRFDEVKAILRVSRDITERKQTERTLRESEQRYRGLFEGAAEGILIADLKTKRFLYANPSVCNMLGYSEEEFRKLSVSDIHPSESLEQVISEFEAQGRGEKSLAPDIPCVRKDGTMLYADIVTSKIIIDGKECNVGFFTDITERKQAEETLQRSYDQLRETFTSAINALASTVEIKDQYTSGHQQRATGLACAIADEIGLSEDQMEGIRMAGLIHDIGKIMVPTEILNKPGPITELQFDIIKTHPQSGYDILRGIKFPWPVAEIVLQHHERMDGSGYPHGITGEEIMLEARILAVADVVEAMSSHRPYRPSLGIDKALDEISQNRGVLYDPDVVDACFRLFTEKGFTFSEEFKTVLQPQATK